MSLLSTTNSKSNYNMVCSREITTSESTSKTVKLFTYEKYKFKISSSCPLKLSSSTYYERWVSLFINTVKVRCLNGLTLGESVFFLTCFLLKFSKLMLFFLSETFLNFSWTLLCDFVNRSKFPRLPFFLVLGELRMSKCCN